MNILFIGDIVGVMGRNIVKKVLFSFCEKYNIDFVIANGENVTHGKGLISKHYDELIEAGIDCITLGNHYNSKNEINRYIDMVSDVVRPINLKNGFGGEGSRVFDVDGVKIRVTNVLGTVFMNEEVISPIQTISEVVNESQNKEIHIIDFHAEATSEKECIGFNFDGKVSAVLGTHTHVQTRDGRILPKGTAFISDVGMCGELESILGFNKESVINKMLYGSQDKFTLNDSGKAVFSAVVLEVDDVTHLCKNIIPIYHVEEV